MRPLSSCLSILLLQLVFSCNWSCTYAQDTLQIKGLYVGVGVGQDVGGLPGARLTYWVTPHFSGFIGGGWALVGGGYNAGVEVRFASRSRTNFFMTGMYGYNGAIKIKGKESLNRIYFGPTAGIGLMLRQRYLLNYWRFSLNLPFRSQEMYDHIEVIKARRDIEIRQGLLPFTVGVGYHFAL